MCVVRMLRLLGAGQVRQGGNAVWHVRVCACVHVVGARALLPETTGDETTHAVRRTEISFRTVDEAGSTSAGWDERRMAWRMDRERCGVVRCVAPAAGR